MGNFYFSIETPESNPKIKGYEKIMEYIKQEAKQFVKFNSWLYKGLPLFLIQFNQRKTVFNN